MALTLSELKTYVLSRLGYPIVEVELAPEHFQQALDQVLRTVAYNRPKERRVSFSVVAGVQEYTIANPGYGVVDVEIPPPEYNMNQQFDVFNPRLIAHPLNIADYELGRVYAEMAKKVMSVDFEWQWNPDTNKVMVSPTPSSSFTAVAVCVEELTGANIISPWLKEWCLKYSLAVCKQTLGAIRRKIKSIEGTETTFDLDGAELIQEGKEEENSLLDNLREKSGDFVPPIMGD